MDAEKLYDALSEVERSELVAVIPDRLILGEVSRRQLNGVASLATTEALTSPEAVLAAETSVSPEPTSAAEASTSPEADTEPVVYDDTDALATLSPERQQRATAVKAAYAEKFSTKEQKLTAEDFKVVLDGEGEAQRAFVMLTTGNGLYRGSYNTIMDNKKANRAAYTVTVDGQTIDSRRFMTWKLYSAFIDAVKAQPGVRPLPDSAALAKENSQPHTGTWLTGEKPDDLRARYGGVDGGDAYRFWDLRNLGWFALRFRPAAEI